MHAKLFGMHQVHDPPGVSASVASMAILSVILVAPLKRFSTSAVTASSFSIARYISALFLIDLYDGASFRDVHSAGAAALIAGVLLCAC